LRVEASEPALCYGADLGSIPDVLAALGTRRREYKSFIVIKSDGEVAFLPDAFGSALRHPGVLVDTNLLVIAWFGKLTATPHVL
jgi:hypothetical protein